MNNTIIKYVITMLISILVCAFVEKPLLSAGEKCDNDKPLPPILDTSFDSKLKLTNHHGRIHKSVPLLSDSINKKLFKSKKVIFMRESWNAGSHGKTIRIDRYHFDCKEDALRYPECEEFSCNWGFPGWPATAEVGDASCWETPFHLIFVKGKVLISIIVTPLNLDEETKNFTLSVARFIAKKL